MSKFLTIALLLTSLNAIASEYRCYGSSPLWGATIQNDSVNFGVGGLAPINEPILSVKNAANRGNGYVQIIKTNSTSITLINESCYDDAAGLPDSVQSHHIVVELPNAVYYGCCNKRK